MVTLYSARAVTTGGRRGKVRFTGSTPPLTLDLPTELGGSTESSYNPEQLLAAAYAACFHSAVLEVICRRRVAAGSVTAEATVDLATREGERGSFRFHLRLSVAIDGLENDEVEKILAEADDICPVADALRGHAMFTEPQPPGADGGQA